MKKSTVVAMKNAPRFVDDTHVLVTKAFAKNARIFGTSEYKMWRAIQADCPDAEMVTKTIKKNPDKKNDTKNMKYKHMAIYIRQQKNAETLMLEFKKQIDLSKVQTNPYRYVLAWFLQTFENYDDYKIYFEELAKKNAQKNDIFAVVKSEVSFEGEDTAEDDEDYDSVSGM